MRSMILPLLAWVLLCNFATVAGRVLPIESRQRDGTSSSEDGHLHAVSTAFDTPDKLDWLVRRGRFNLGSSGGGSSSNPGLSPPGRDNSPDPNDEEGGVNPNDGSDPNNDSDRDRDNDEDDDGPKNAGDHFNMDDDFDPFTDEYYDPSLDESLTHHGVTSEDRARSIARAEVRVTEFDRGEGRPSQDGPYVYSES